MNTLVSPHYADFTGVPPTPILCDKDEILHANSSMLAQRMTQKKVTVKLVERQKYIHVWMLFTRLILEARKDLKVIVAHLLSASWAAIFL